MPEHEARSLIEKARQEVYALAAGRRRWRMSIPAQADDSDFVICAGLDALEALLTAGETTSVKPVCTCRDDSGMSSDCAIHLAGEASHSRPMADIALCTCQVISGGAVSLNLSCPLHGISLGHKLSAPMAAGLLLTLKSECEAQHARAELAEHQIATLTAERDEARTDVTRMAQTRVGEKCRHHLDPLLTLEFLAQRECPICWMSAAQNSEALYRAEKTKAEAAEARATALEAALKQIASLDNVHEPERGQDQRPPMIVALGRWNQCCQIAKRALLTPPPPSRETT